MINETEYKNISTERKADKIKCIFCESSNYSKQGYRSTKNRGKIQKYYCNDCKRFFTNDDGFYRMRNNSNKITLCMDLFYRGISLRKIQEHLQSFYPHNSHYSNIYRWIVKYSKMISNFTDGFKIESGKEMQIDEMEYHRREKHRKGSKNKVSKDWFIDSIDCKTRYMLSSEYVKSRGIKEIKRTLNKVKYKTQGNITTITTDGLNAYTYTVKQVFGYYNFQRGQMFHNVNINADGDGFNIFIERLHNSIRERTKTFRGFHGSIESADAIMKGYEVFYNFIRKHQAINCCPYELAIPNLKLNSENKWLELIEMSKKINSYS